MRGQGPEVAEAPLLSPLVSCQNLEFLAPELTALKTSHPHTPCFNIHDLGVQGDTGGPSLATHLLRTDPASLPPSASPTQMQRAQATPLPPWTPPSAPSLPSGCRQGHLKIHVRPSHLKPAMAVASTALQSPAPTPSHPFSPPFTPLLQPQASRPPRKANSMQPRDLCTCRFIRPGCSARALPSGPSPLSTHMSLPLRSRPSPPWLKWPL